MSNGKSIVKKSSKRESGMGSSTMPLSGAIYLPSTANSIEDWLTSLRLGSHVKDFQPPEKGLARKTKEICGPIRSASYAKWDQDLRFWKIPQISFLSDILAQSLGNFTKLGSMRNGKLSEPMKSEHRTKEKDSGYWRTPDTGAGGTSGLLKQGIKKRENGQMIQIRLVDQVFNPNLRQNGGIKTRPKYTTPTATMAERSKKFLSGADRVPNPAEVARIESGKSGQLNPLWVEWLMGWPIGWTSTKPLEMAKFHEWLSKHGID